MKEYYGEQTKKAIRNFPFNFRKLPKSFFHIIAEIKKANALAHLQAKELDKKTAMAIAKACDEVVAGKFDEQFVLPAFQGGAGTSNHMNVNEVVANRASEILGVKVHPNDQVNMAQSTNDVMPSALRILTYRLSQNLVKEIDQFIFTLEKKGSEFKNIQKLGRTHLQDAVPITLGGEFYAYADYTRSGKARIEMAMQKLLDLNLGGNAVGNSVNASSNYIRYLYAHLKKITGLPVRMAKNLMAKTSSGSDFVWLSQSLTAFCVDLSKISNDLRWLSAGPKGGIGELSMPELQAGSSIMPGKVNPVLSEAISQLYFLVSGNNLTIEHAAEGAQLELGVMLPIATDRLNESLTLAAQLLKEFSERCVAGIKAHPKRAKELLENSTAYATYFAPIFGYDLVSQTVKEALALGKTFRQIVLEKKLLSNKEFDAVIKKNLK